MPSEPCELQLQGHELLNERIKLAEVLLQMKQSDEVISLLTDLDEDRLTKDEKRRRRMTIGLALCQKAYQLNNEFTCPTNFLSICRQTIHELCIFWRKCLCKEWKEQRLQRPQPSATRCRAALLRLFTFCRQLSMQHTTIRT